MFAESFFELHEYKTKEKNHTTEKRKNNEVSFVEVIDTKL